MLRSISPGATVAELAEVMQIGDLELLRASPTSSASAWST